MDVVSRDTAFYKTLGEIVDCHVDAFKLKLLKKKKH